MSCLPSVPKVFSSRRWRLTGWWPPLRHGLRWFVRLGLGLILAAWGLLLLAWLILHWLILPHLEQWRGTLETHASAALGVSVKLGHIQVRSSGWVPSVELKQVQLLDSQGRVALTLPLVTAAMSPQSLLHLDLRLDQLIIDGAQMEIRRNAQGQVFIAGLDPRRAANNGHAALDWLFKQHEVVVRGGNVQWVDELRSAPPLELTDVQLVVRNGLRRHQIRFDATPPSSWGQRLSLRGRFTQPLLARPGDWKRWTGEGHLDMPRANVGELRRYVTLPFELHEGQGGLRAWAQLQSGALKSVTLDLALRAVEARLAPGLEPLRLEQVAGRLIGKLETRSRGGFSNNLDQQDLELVGKGLSFVTQDGVVWPSGDFSFKVEQRRQLDGRVVVTGGELRAPQINLGVLAGIGSRLPLGSAVNQLLREAQPQGEMSGLALRWQGPMDAPTTYQARARVTGLFLAAKPAPNDHGVGRPGVVGAQMDIEATQSGGSSQVTLDGGRLVLPGVFSDPVLAFDQLSAKVQWLIEPVPSDLPRVVVKWNQVKFANRDMQGEISGQWRTGEGALQPTSAAARLAPQDSTWGKGQRLPGHLVLDGKLSRGDASKTSRYLPQAIPEAVRDYLRRALNQGRITAATLRIQGDLAEFPFVNATNKTQGEFRFSGQVQGATFAYVPDLPAQADQAAWTSPWPALTDISGEVAIERDQLTIRHARARVMDVVLRDVNGEVSDLGAAGKATVRMQGQGRGELAKILKFVETSPVGAWIGGGLSHASATGDGDLSMRLNLPIFDLAASTIQGRLELLGNDVRLRQDLPLLAAARGQVAFTHQGFSIKPDMTAQVLGGELRLTGGTQADRVVRISGSGNATAQGLQRTPELGALTRLGSFLGGGGRYQLDLALAGGRAEVDLRSDLLGWSSQLPAPLHKAATYSLPLHYKTRWTGSSPGGRSLMETVTLDIGSAVSAHYVREWPNEPAQAKEKVVRGTLGLGVAAPTLPSSGVVAQAAMQTLNVNEWQRLIQQLERASAGATQSGAPVSDDALLQSYLPTQWRLKADEVRAGTTSFREVDASAVFERGEWRVGLNSQQASGRLVWRGASGQQPGRLFARLSRLSLASESHSQNASASEALAFGSVPSLDLIAEDFELRGKKLGRLEVQAVNTGALGTDGANDWKLQSLELITPDARLSATGQWSIPIDAPSNAGPDVRPKRQTELNFKWKVSDAGALLDRLGQEKAVRGGKGEVVGQLRWSASPLNPDPLSMSGHMKLDIGAGQFLRQGAGGARLLSVLSLQALPRRLLLDFRDVFQEGFAFDSVTGDVQMNQGVASTNNLRMSGVQAVVLIEGQASLQNETQDLRVYMVPEINFGSASLAYAAINPALGLGSFVAQLVLRKPLAEANTREFRITGPWADPQVERVEKPSFVTPLSAERDAAFAPDAAASAATLARPAIPNAKP